MSVEKTLNSGSRKPFPPLHLISADQQAENKVEEGRKTPVAMKGQKQAKAIVYFTLILNT
jgi:hypothetical protein